jgi:tRNA nucleotidyltransferase (CCA-adding enzyme)
MIPNFITLELHDLRKQFQAEGFDLRLVGGCVRDWIAGHPAKDIDLCTDADPDEQIAIYKQFNYRFEPTGINHGTITVVLNGKPFEITSLRLDVATDGRRATVAYTRDWIADLERRDLTINAMSMTFDGELVDPFNGREDLANGVVRFVGDADQRIREDYLRILRWFRFACRISGIESSTGFDDEAWHAIYKNRQGLRQISRERVWSEIKAILKHPNGPSMLDVMCIAGIHTFIDMPDRHTNTGGNSLWWCDQAWKLTKSPEILMLAWCGWDKRETDKLAEDWKWSNAERVHVEWIATHLWDNRDLRRLIAVENAPRKWVAELASLEERDAWEQNALVYWDFKPFPVDGNDLIARGCKPGPKMGILLNQLKDQWADSGYVATKEELLSKI